MKCAVFLSFVSVSAGLDSYQTKQLAELKAAAGEVARFGTSFSKSSRKEHAKNVLLHLSNVTSTAATESAITDCKTPLCQQVIADMSALSAGLEDATTACDTKFSTFSCIRQMKGIKEPVNRLIINLPKDVDDRDFAKLVSDVELVNTPSLALGAFVGFMLGVAALAVHKGTAMQPML